jgi:hypothetical protein
MNRPPHGPKPEEWAVLLSTSITPALVLTISIFTTHMFVYRYVVWTAPAFSLLATALLFQAVAGRARGATVALVCLLPTLIAIESREVLARRTLREAERFSQQLSRLPSSPLQIVVANPHVYMELAYYANPELKHRLVYLTQPYLALSYLGYDTDSLLLAAIGHRVPSLRSLPLEEFLPPDLQFILATDRSYWCYSYFLSNGYRMTPIGENKQSLLYLVSSPSGRKASLVKESPSSIQHKTSSTGAEVETASRDDARK